MPGVPWTGEAAMPAQDYAPPTITRWGSVADITRGMGNTSSTDDFTCTAGNNTFTGSTGMCPPGQN